MPAGCGVCAALKHYLPLVPGLTDVVPDLAAPTRADPDTERYALFDAVVAVLEVASDERAGRADSRRSSLGSQANAAPVAASAALR